MKKIKRQKYNIDYSVVYVFDGIVHIGKIEHIIYEGRWFYIILATYHKIDEDDITRFNDNYNRK